MTARRACALVLLATLVVACASESSTSAPSPTASSSASPLPSVTAITSPTAPASKPVLVLEPDGLGVLVGESSIRHFTFASSGAAEITSVVSHVLGAGRTTSLPECGQGPRSTYQVKGLSLLLDGKRFVGWHEQGAPGRTLTSADGVGIGMTLAKLKSLRPAVKVRKESLSAEFYEDEDTINGFLDGRSSSSRVTSVYAGETCFFR
jgi:hypothetical protein